MKKIAINRTLKKIFTSIAWLHRIRKISSMYRKYKKDDQSLSAQARNDYLLKLSKKLLKVNNIDLEIIGFENIPKSGGTLLAANHKSSMDPVALLAALEKQDYEQGSKNRIVNFLAKKELDEKFLVKRILKLTDSTVIDRENFRESFQKLNEFGEFIRINKTIGVVFPEGTRVQTPKLGEFKSGAFKITASNYLTIVPVAIINSLNAQNKKRVGRLKITVSFLKPLKPANYLTQDAKALAQRVKNLIQEEMKKYE
ncbi:MULTISPECIES: 1-acyl-sn-glycerol-3-phosphate acyltransferase [unclassified Mycoplasma]|uniref:lysophospholipid acyltransferase family protein n=1 Tax=unclassified Mycoplasma TaxID=2683645 RepID=UPI00211C4659|nr:MULTISPECIES: lysophospholipid acyltransferase family protein [unclassified Mycoplasma]UUM19942.1 1-acyl-sn-glycerol-3-phosphate acyltransferase [Mycoplasma sp. 1578d]UUM24923.1 1-acyl-sn-glycerol-3-phosphate acyltransferase [Mycoplasma sp. 3686d]